MYFKCDKGKVRHYKKLGFKLHILYVYVSKSYSLQNLMAILTVYIFLTGLLEDSNSLLLLFFAMCLCGFCYTETS
jgi:hypothetical protein